MTSKFRNPVAAGFLLVAALMLPADAAAGEMTDGVGGVYGPPETVRFWQITDGVGDPWCEELPASTVVTLFSETFVTNPTTSYIELNWTGQFAVRSGVTVRDGIIFQIQLIQSGQPTVFFPGAGDDTPPLMSRRDDSGNGQETFTGYHGIIAAVPATTTRIVIKALSSQKDALACYQNLSVRYD